MTVRAHGVPPPVPPREREKPYLQGRSNPSRPTRKRGDKIVLLLHGYDKGESSSSRHQEAQIKTAKARLKLWLARKAAEEKQAARQPKKAEKPKGKGKGKKGK